MSLPLPLPPILPPPEGYYDAEFVKQEYLRNWKRMHGLPPDAEIERIRGVILDERRSRPSDAMLEPDYVFAVGEDNQAHFFCTIHYDPSTRTLTHFYRTISSVDCIDLTPMTEEEATGFFAGRSVRPDRTRLILDKTPEEMAQETVRKRRGPGALTKAARPSPPSMHNSQ